MAEVLNRHFVCVRVYCQSMAEEQDPRGSKKYPQFTFQDRGVPLILILDPEAKELERQLGMSADAEVRLREMILSALKRHGPATPPKETASLRKDLESARKAFDQGKCRDAGSRLRKLEAGRLAKQYPGEDAPPAVAEVRQLRARFEEAAAQALEEARTLEGSDPAAALKAFRKVADDFEASPEVAKASREAVSRLQKAAPPR